MRKARPPALPINHRLDGVDLLTAVKNNVHHALVTCFPHSFPPSRDRRALALEKLALRQQLSVLL